MKSMTMGNIIFDESSFAVLHSILIETLSNKVPTVVDKSSGSLPEVLSRLIKGALRGFSDDDYYLASIPRSGPDKYERYSTTYKEANETLAPYVKVVALHAKIHELNSKYEDSEVVLLSPFCWKLGDEPAFEFHIRRPVGKTTILYGGLTWNKEGSVWQSHT